MPPESSLLTSIFDTLTILAEGMVEIHENKAHGETRVGWFVLDLEESIHLFREFASGIIGRWHTNKVPMYSKES